MRVTVESIGHLHEPDHDTDPRDAANEMVGVRCYADLRFYLPQFPDGTYSTMRIESPGLWGVEVSEGAWTDDDTAHIREIEEEQQEELLGMLAALGFAREQGNGPHGLGHVLDTLETTLTDPDTSHSAADDAEVLYEALKATDRRIEPVG